MNESTAQVHKTLELTEAEVDCVLDKILTFEALKEPGGSFYFYGHGGLSKKEVRELAEDSNLSVLWSGSTLPWLLFPLKWIPNEAIFIKVLNISVLKEKFYDVGNGTMISVLFLRGSNVDRYLKKGGRVSQIDLEKELSENSDFISFEVDLDSDDSTGKMYSSFRCSPSYGGIMSELLCLSGG